MIAVLTVLIALPLGWFVRHRLTACVAYGLAFAHVYTFQTAVLLMAWSEDPAGDGMSDSVEYLMVTTAIYAAGFGLVTLGGWLRARRDRHGPRAAANAVG